MRRNMHLWTYGPAYYPECHLIAQRYARQIQCSHVAPYEASIVNSFLLIDSNAVFHADRPVESMFKISTIQRRELLAYSLAFGRASLGHTQMTQFTFQGLYIVLLEECNKIFQSLIDNLSSSVENKCATIIAVPWGPQTIYKSFIFFKQIFL